MNSETDVLELLKELEWPIFAHLREAENFNVTDIFEHKVRGLWKIYGKEATCAAPPWRSNVSRVEIASRRASNFVASTELQLEDIPARITKSEVGMIQLYSKNLKERYEKSAKALDENSKAAASVAAVLLALGAAVLMGGQE